jgi:alpha-mannosidase
MADHRPFWKGKWRMRLFRSDGREVACQEEQPESLLPFNNWRRRISFADDLPGVGVARYYLKAFEIPEREHEKGRRASPASSRKPDSPIRFRFDSETGLLSALQPAGFARSLAGPLFEPLVVEDTADSWGTGRGRYRKIVGRFKPSARPLVIEQGPVRTVTRAVLSYRKSRLVMDVVTYPSWPVLEFRFRVTWNEERRRLKLSVPTALSSPTLLAEIPGGAIRRPEDGEEHVHGRWLVVEGRSAGKTAALGIASSGQNGLDFKDGEIRLSVLRSSAYCHERGFELDTVLGAPAPKPGTAIPGTCPMSWKFADIGVHEFRLLVTAGAAASVTAMMPGLADYLAAPPAAYAHLPYDAKRTGQAETLLALKPSSIRLLACKRSWDGSALIVRLQEAVGKGTKAELEVSLPASQERGHEPEVPVTLSFTAFELKTLRFEKDGTWRAVRMIEED